MGYAQRQRRATHKPPNAASVRGLQAALAALYSTDPVTPEEIAAHEHTVRSVPQHKPQAELALPLRSEGPTDP